jgi:hypothetical protein
MYSPLTARVGTVCIDADENSIQLLSGQVNQAPSRALNRVDEVYRVTETLGAMRVHSGAHLSLCLRVL